MSPNKIYVIRLRPKLNCRIQRNRSLAQAFEQVWFKQKPAAGLARKFSHPIPMLNHRQRRENQGRLPPLHFGSPNGCGCCVCRMVRQGELNKNI